ncbi:uncharacterized protein TRAVEDRAFT_58596 [Trametes versicolor FP-101664 SS1]|uniref:uncharacterized protein n=1 Tax=Trametes versicolor (strain FP-101664) TaxID=717944 RepID=UPI00046217A0|nr:uncharacterized protein TRAVEDRAFT_58596 [Trametes versicolor FP-101664 SS1]EIW58250.1 hypothetical protein TRAVEDRAFT_58596 [Trametes versicolor FP-101664 SS1]
MPHFGSPCTPSPNPENRKLEASIISEAGAEQKHIDHTLRDLADAVETHDKSTKDAVNSQRAVDEAAETAKTNQQREARLGLNLAQKAGHLDDLQQRKAQNDQLRESALAQIHAQDADVPV